MRSGGANKIKMRGYGIGRKIKTVERFSLLVSSLKKRYFFSAHRGFDD